MKQNKYHYQKLIQTIREGRLVPERNGSYWEEKERKELIALYHEGVGITELALHFSRSESAIFQQLAALELLAPSETRRPREKREALPCCLCGECRCIDCPRKQENGKGE